MWQPKLVGVVNATPDSFSDGGAYDPAEQALALIEQGADVIDIGAESTRPTDADPVEEAEEWARLEPVLQVLRKEKATLSVDTYKPAIAERCLDMGVDWINDVKGFADEKMAALCAERDCTCVVMHSLTIPANPHITLPEHSDVIDLLSIWADETLTRLVKSGIDANRIILDPGVGFGKTAKQSMSIVIQMHKLQTIHTNWLVGHSRKSFMTLFTQSPPAERDAMTRAFSYVLAEQNVRYLRVHDIEGHRKMFGHV